ncbi:MAG: ATP-binding protein [Planctomycetaceae bacterium]
MPKANLLVIQGVDQGTRFELGTQTAGVGRGVKNKVRILDTEVSRRHAEIHYENGGYVVVDRGSSNGTFVNGAPVRSHRLVNGDQVQCGRTVLVFSDPGAVDDESRYVAEQIDLLAEDSPDDRSQIVSAVRDEPSAALTTAGRPTPPDVQRTLANLQALYRISEEAVSPSVSLDQLLKRVLDVTIEVVGADRGCILIRNPNSDEIVPQAFSDRRAEVAPSKMPVSRSIVNYVVREERGVRTADAQHDQRFDTGQSILQAGIREAMCVPIQGRHLLGVIYVDTTTPPGQPTAEPDGPSIFSEDQLRLLAAIGRQTAQAVENNRYQHALVSAERLAAMGQTIAMLSHHIKNILQGVRGGSYLIDMGLNDHDEDVVRKGWNIVEKNQGKIYHLVMDMLAFSKERQPALEPADLNETVADVCELMQARAEECGVRFQFEPAGPLPATTFDKDGIHRAVLNVVINAIDATEGIDGAEVSVRTGFLPADNAFFVDVRDNGPGIPENIRPQIFNLFASSKGTRGTGLGLAVSRKIIREHSGEITLESDPETGTRFRLSWPRFEEEQPPPKSTLE